MMKRLIIFYLVLQLIGPFAYSSDFNEQLRIKLETLRNSNLEVADRQLTNYKTLNKCYQDILFEPLWANKDYINELIIALDGAVSEGLEPEDYHIKSLKTLISVGPNIRVNQRINLEILATDALILYTSHLLYGKVNPTTIDPEWHVINKVDYPIHLIKGVNKTGINYVLNEVLPTHSVYASLKEALKKYRKISSNGGWDKIPEGNTMKFGDTNERVRILRERLYTTRDLKVNNAKNTNLFDETLAEAVMIFQRKHGLGSSGEVDEETLLALNVNVKSRINQIIVNLERWRWLPQTFENYYIKVNIADFSLSVHKNQITERQYKVIVGRDYRRTPVFSSILSYLVFNPTWTVPPGILKADILPAVRRNSTYLKSKNISVYDSQGNKVDVASIDWNSKDTYRYTYRQAAGVDNALGAVKFMFPNNFNVYIHDTPSKELFEKTERLFSSGCIRVQQPLDLAEYLLQDQIAWSRNKIDQTLSSKKTITVPLLKKPAIYILYWTAWTDINDQIQFRRDVYNRDNKVLSALNLDY